MAQNRLPVPSEDAWVKNCRSRLKRSRFKLGTAPNCCASSRPIWQADLHHIQCKRSLNRARNRQKTDSQLTPNNLSSPYFCVLLSRHSCLIVNNIRDCAVTHNPKVAGSNPAPSTNQINNLQKLAAFGKSPLSPIRNNCHLLDSRNTRVFR